MSWHDGLAGIGAGNWLFDLLRRGAAADGVLKRRPRGCGGGRGENLRGPWPKVQLVWEPEA